MMMEQAARDSFLDGFSTWPVDDSFDAWLDQKMAERAIAGQNRDRLALQSASLNEIEHAYERIVFNNAIGTPIITFDMVELARVHAPYGSITTLSKIETWLGTTTGRTINTNSKNLFETNFGRYWLIYVPHDSPRFIYNPGGNYGAHGSIVGQYCYPFNHWLDLRYSFGNRSLSNYQLVPGYDLALFYQHFDPAPFPQNWTAGIAYKKGDIVRQGNDFFVCVLEHLSATPPPSIGNVRWEILLNGMADYSLSLWGRLTVRTQTERNAQAVNQARESFTI